MNAQLDWTHETTLFKLRQPLRTAKGLISDRHSVTLRVGNGHEAACGLGEASPLPGWSPEDHNDVLKELVKLPRQLPRFQPRAPESLNQWLDELEITSSSLRFAVAAALVDYEAQTRGQSFGDMLGERRATSIPIAMLCTDSTTAASAYQQGVRVFKVKAGLNVDAETKLLSELVSLGPDVSVRVEFRWPPADASDSQRLAARKPEHHRRDAGHTDLVAVEHTQRQASGNAGIDGVAAVLEDAVARRRCEVVPGGDHVGNAAHGGTL